MTRFSDDDELPSSSSNVRLAGARHYVVTGQVDEAEPEGFIVIDGRAPGSVHALISVDLLAIERLEAALAEVKRGILARAALAIEAAGA